MRTIVLIKYSLTMILFFFFSNCGQKKNNTKSKTTINSEVQNLFIVKEKDSIIVTRKHYDQNNEIIDSVFLKIRNKSTMIKFPQIAPYSLDLLDNISYNKNYSFSSNDFLIVAGYRDFIIQYQFDYKSYVLKKIFIIKNIDEVYPDFNRKPQDTIARIQVVNIYKSEKNDFYLDHFVDEIYNDKLKINQTYYILRKEGINKYIK